MRRGELYLVNPQPAKGVELAKIRPALIVSSDAINPQWSVATSPTPCIYFRFRRNNEHGGACDLEHAIPVKRAIRTSRPSTQRIRASGLRSNRRKMRSSFWPTPLAGGLGVQS